MTTLLRVSRLLFNQPLCAAPEAAELIAAALAGRWGLAEPGEDDIAALRDASASRFVGRPGPAIDGERPAWRVENGVAIVPILGELTTRGAWIGASSGLVSYEGLTATLQALAADAAVRGVVLDVNSPGGSAAGAFETAAEVARLAQIKPVVALANPSALSAAYALVSAATKIVVPPSGMLGSIGVAWLHLDRSAQMEKSGVKPTLLTMGLRKGDGNPLAPLGADAKARIEASMAQVFDLFVATVAANRRLDPAAVRTLEAGVLMGRSAVDAGLADQVGVLADALALVDALSAQRPLFPGASMTAQTPQPTAATTPDLDAIRAQAAATAASEASTRAAAETRAAVSAEMSAALTTLFPGDARAAAFSEALADGVAIPTAAKLAARVPAAAAPAKPPFGALAPQPDIRPDAAVEEPKTQFEQGAAAFARALGKPAA